MKVTPRDIQHRAYTHALCALQRIARACHVYGSTADAMDSSLELIGGRTLGHHHFYELILSEAFRCISAVELPDNAYQHLLQLVLRGMGTILRNHRGQLVHTDTPIVVLVRLLKGRMKPCDLFIIELVHHVSSNPRVCRRKTEVPM